MKYFFKSLLLILFCLGLLASFASPVLAFTPEQRQQLEQQTFYDPTDTASGAICGSGSTGPQTTDVDLSGSSNAEKIFNYFTKTRGLSAIQAAGIMGNMEAESGFESDLVEYGFNNGQGQISEPGQPSSHVDKIPPDTNSKGQPGYGLVQWSGGRKAGLQALLNSRNITNASDLATQLDYVWQELNTSYKSSVLDPLLATSSLEQATYIWLAHYEIPADIAGNEPVRLGFAQNILDQTWAGGSGGSSIPTSTTSSGDSSCDTTGSSSTATGVVAKVIAIAQQELAAGANEADGSYLKYTDGAHEDWCADFLSWVLNQAGIPFTGGLSGGWRIPAVENVLAWFQQNNAFKPARQGYVPQVGNIVIYKQGVAPTKSHVGVIVAVIGQSITVISGNYGNKVGENVESNYDAPDITGFGILKGQ